MSRIETRESVVKFIYQTAYRQESVEDQLSLYIEENPELEEDRDFFVEMALGIMSERGKLDEHISKFLSKWTINRLPRLDRAILETACYEILYRDDIPVSVSINEAVRLAKRYGTEESPSYINGVLSSFEKSL